ncbi:unnamed protein product [Amoebophrya sp. A120]|nr:unnamed protein product [Amoebophrya sp. A120]|eukprot:GSA120T00023450001.1
MGRVSTFFPSNRSLALATAVGAVSHLVDLVHSVDAASPLRTHENQKFWDKLREGTENTSNGGGATEQEEKMAQRERLFDRALELATARSSGSSSSSAAGSGKILPAEDEEREYAAVVEIKSAKDQVESSQRTSSPSTTTANEKDQDKDSENGTMNLQTTDPEIAKLLLQASEQLRTASHIVYQHVNHVALAAKKQKNNLPVHEESDWILDSKAKLLDYEDEVTLKKDKTARIHQLEPLMEPEVATMGDVLTNCRKGREAAGDVIKRDLYHPRADKVRVSKEVKEVARELQDVAGEIRSEYMKMIMGFANAIVENFSENKPAHHSAGGMKNNLVELQVKEKEKSLAKTDPGINIKAGDQTISTSSATTSSSSTRIISRKTNSRAAAGSRTRSSETSEEKTLPDVYAF